MYPVFYGDNLYNAKFAGQICKDLRLPQNLTVLCASKTLSIKPEYQSQKGGSHKISDLTSESDTDVTCNHYGTTFAAYVFNSASDCTATLDYHPEINVLADNVFFSPSDDDDWLNDNLPENPAGIFMDSHHHSGDILAEYGVGGTAVLSHSAFIFNRMVFAQQISALEAYLGDTLIQQVMFDKNALDRLLDKEEDLRTLCITP